MTQLIHLAAYSPPHAGSFVPFLRSVLGAGRERGWEVGVVLPGKAAGNSWVSDFEQDGIRVDYADGSRRELTRWVRGRLPVSEEPTILHTHFTTYDVPAVLAIRGRAEVKLYWHVHTVLSNRPRARLANRAKFSLLGPRVDRILTPAENVATELIRRGAPRDRVSVFPNTIDSQAFGVVSPAERVSFRAELGLPQDRQVLLHFGRDWYLKDGDAFLDTLAELVEAERPAIGLINQGGDEARRAVRGRGLEDHIRFVGVQLDPRRLYGAADLLVACSRGETMPFAVIEALSSGIPVVASDLAGHRYVSDRIRSCVIAPRDPVRMAAAISAFLDLAPAERASDAEAANAWIREHLDVHGAAERLVDSYESGLGEPLLSGESAV